MIVVVGVRSHYTTLRVRVAVTVAIISGIGCACIGETSKRELHMHKRNQNLAESTTSWGRYPRLPSLAATGLHSHISTLNIKLFFRSGCKRLPSYLKLPTSSICVYTRIEPLPPAPELIPVIIHTWKQSHTSIFLFVTERMRHENEERELRSTNSCVEHQIGELACFCLPGVQHSI